jgi:hypothetical protein
LAFPAGAAPAQGDGPLPATARGPREAELNALLDPVSKGLAEGKLPEAIAAAEAAQAIARDARGERSEEAIGLLEMVAMLREKHEEWAPAIDARRRALEARVAASCPVHWKSVDARFALVRIEALAAMGADARRDLAEADRLLLQAGALRRRGRDAKAVAPARRALELRHKVWGEGHHETLVPLGNLAVLLSASGDRAAARLRYEQSLEQRQAMLGEDHPTLS